VDEGEPWRLARKRKPHVQLFPHECGSDFPYFGGGFPFSFYSVFFLLLAFLLVFGTIPKLGDEVFACFNRGTPA